VTATAIWAALRRIPLPIWYIGMALLLGILVWRWHSVAVNEAFAKGGIEQLAVDEKRFRQASVAAEARQEAVRSALQRRQLAVSKGTDDALLAKHADLARRYDDLRLRWAAYRADQGSPGEGGATALPGAAAGADDAACAAQGWVSFDTAAAAAEAADTAIARDDAWRAWVTAQAAAWPEE
jgi:hypothetical protein